MKTLLALSLNYPMPLSERYIKKQTVPRSRRKSKPFGRLSIRESSENPQTPCSLFPEADPDFHAPEKHSISCLASSSNPVLRRRIFLRPPHYRPRPVILKLTLARTT